MLLLSCVVILVTIKYVVVNVTLYYLLFSFLYLNYTFYFNSINIIISYTMASNGTSFALTCCQRNECSLQNTERSVDIRRDCIDLEK